jgi:tetratricopeptide (TPR) repeat protein
VTWHATAACWGMMIFVRSLGAQSSDENRIRCGGKNVDLRIGGCTAVIHSGQETNENLASAFYNRAAAYNEMGDYDRAIQDYDQAVLLKPSFAEAFSNRGSQYLAKGNYDRAIQDYDQALRLKPNDAAAFYNRGIAYFDKGDNDRAILDYDQALRLTPKDANVFTSRGLTYSAKGNYDRAIQDYDQVLRLTPNDAYAYRRRGEARFNQGLFKAAVPDLAKAVELKPRDAYHVLVLHLALAHTDGESASILARNSRALKLDEWPGPMVSMFLGKTSVSTAMQAAKSDDPRKDREQRCEATFYGGEWLLLHGSRDPAAAMLETAVKTCPHDFTEYESAGAELRRLRP